MDAKPVSVEDPTVTPTSPQNRALEQDSDVGKETSVVVVPEGNGAVVPVQPDAGTVPPVAPATPGVAANSPASAPVPRASALSTQITAVRRALEGVTRPKGWWRRLD